MNASGGKVRSAEGVGPVDKDSENADELSSSWSPVIANIIYDNLSYSAIEFRWERDKTARTRTHKAVGLTKLKMFPRINGLKQPKNGVKRTVNIEKD